MVDRPLIHSKISSALTVIDELGDDECLALLRWIGAELMVVTGEGILTGGGFDLRENYLDVASEMRAHAAPAIAKLQQLLSR